jgi:hypothetical protein
MTLKDSKIFRNTATFSEGEVIGGGGIYNFGQRGTATLTLIKSQIFGNTAAHYGGGIYSA